MDEEEARDKVTEQIEEVRQLLPLLPTYELSQACFVS